MAIRILIVDDHPLVRAGLQLLLRRDPKLEVVGEAADGTQAIEMAHHLQPDVILMELLLPDGDGIPTTATIRQEFPQTQVLILTGILGKTRVVEAMQAGASGYMFKDERPTELRTAIRTVAAGQVHLSPRATTALLDELRAPNHREPSAPVLTPDNFAATIDNPFLPFKPGTTEGKADQEKLVKSKSASGKTARWPR